MTTPFDWAYLPHLHEGSPVKRDVFGAWKGVCCVCTRCSAPMVVSLPEGSKARCRCGGETRGVSGSEMAAGKAVRKAARK